MEKFLDSCDKEYMKMAMLKHEQMFKEQVYELHRLYEIQKMLMRNTSSNKQNQDKCTNMMKKQKLDLEQPNEENNDELDEGEIELTLGPSSYCRRRKMSDETPLASDSGLSLSSSSSGSNHIKRTNSGNNSTQDRRKQQVIPRDWGLTEAPNNSGNASFLRGRRSSSDMKEQVRQDRVQHPRWLCQALSMNIS